MRENGHLTRDILQHSHATYAYHFVHVVPGIRLAQILPGIGNKGVSINLVDSFVTGPAQIPYDALSYTWGDGARTKTITCNGKRMSVTETLLSALHRFRDPDNVVTLWIDQLCICKPRTGNVRNNTTKTDFQNF